jgi:VWFA-related protein
LFQRLRCAQFCILLKDVPLWNKWLHACKPCFTVKAMNLRSVRSALLALLIGCALGVAEGQEPPAPTFRAGTTLVEFTIVATDRDGQPVTDLTQDDITIVQGGKPRQVDFFRFEGSAFAPGDVPRAREPIAPGLFTNRPEYNPGPARNVTALVIDSLNTLPEDQIAVRAQVMQFLRALAPNTRVAVYVMGTKVRILHDFTADAEALRERLAKLKPEYNIQAAKADELVRLQEIEAEHLNRAVESSDQEVDEDARADAERQAALTEAKGQMARAEEYFAEQLHMRRMNQTTASLEAIGNHLAGIPGRKNLVWISGGIPVITQGARDRWVNSYSAQVRNLAQRLATQGITVYPVQATGLQVGFLGTTTVAEGSSRGQAEKQQLRPMTRENDQRIWSTMDMLADVTGGRSFKNTNELTVGVKAAATDMRGSYTVGFYVPDNSDNRWHEFDVRVRRTGVRILHRKGYMALAPVKQPLNWSQDEWEAAVRNPLGSTAVRLDARADAVPNGVSLLIQISSDDLYFKQVNNEAVTELEIGLGERNANEWTRVRRDGATITVKLDPQKSGIAQLVRFSKVWTMTPDTTALRLIVRDRLSGRFGVLDMPLGQIRH